MDVNLIGVNIYLYIYIYYVIVIEHPLGGFWKPHSVREKTIDLECGMLVASHGDHSHLDCCDRKEAALLLETSLALFQGANLVTLADWSSCFSFQSFWGEFLPCAITFTLEGEKMHIYICIHTYVHTYVHIYIHIYTYIHIYIYTYIHIHIYIIHIYLHIHIHIYIYINIHKHMYIYIYTHLHLYFYICIYIYIYISI